MGNNFFNYDVNVASGRWDRWTFLRHWWHFYKRDPYWVPPAYRELQQVLRGRHPHLARLSPRYLHLEALPRPHGPGLSGSYAAAGGWARPVAATALLHDPRRRDGAHTLSLLRCANDEETLKRLLEAAAEESGARAVVGPTHLSPYLGAGVLASHWSELPPLHTPYNPPYLPELLDAMMEVAGIARLYQITVSAGGERETRTGPATLQPLQPERLADELLPLLVAACAPWSAFPAPDSAEASFLLRWLGRWPLSGIVAVVQEEPAGFVLLQPDLAPRLQRAGGGRNLLWRLWLQRTALGPAAQGRLLFGAVLPHWRGEGIGSQLLASTLAHARQQGWQQITVGPLPEGTAAGDFLRRREALPRQDYRFYRWQAPAPAFFF